MGGYTIRENFRPYWMANENGQRLELDFFIEELSVAIEVQGQQHYSFVKHFHKDYQSFLDQVKVDKQKKNICKRNMVILMHVFDTESADIAINDIINLSGSQELTLTENQKIMDDLFTDKYSDNRSNHKKITENKKISKMIRYIILNIKNENQDESARKMMELVKLYHSKTSSEEKNVMAYTINNLLNRAASKNDVNNSVYHDFVNQFMSLVESY